MAALARGGRTNLFGFIIRLVGRIPFLLIGGRIYGPEALGRLAYAVLVIEFAAQIATLGLKRGLALQLTHEERDPCAIVWDAMLLVLLTSALLTGLLIAFPEAMFPNSTINGKDQLLPLVIFGIAGGDVLLAALAYRYDVAATVRARAIVEPWTISIAAFAFSFYSLRDGLILSYVLATLASFLSALIGFVRTYRWPKGWSPRPVQLIALTQRNLPLAAADAIELGSRRLDLAILGLFVGPATVGIYYVAQQLASLPQKLKTSFDPVLGPVITRNLEIGDKPAIAKAIGQAGFWILAAQVGIALALGIPGEAIMGVVGKGGSFVGGSGALAFLLLAEVVASPAVVSEHALVYVARHKNLMLSLITIAIQAALSFTLVLALRAQGMNEHWMAAGVAAALAIALAISSILKTHYASRLLGAPVSLWRPSLLWATAATTAVGATAALAPEWLEIVVGEPAMLGIYAIMIWRYGFNQEDRRLFRARKANVSGSLASAP